MKLKHFARCPFRLLDLINDPKSSFNKSHAVFYMELYRRSNWKNGFTLERKKKTLCKDFGIKSNRFDMLIKDLIDAKFIKRMYAKGQKRSSDVRIRFLGDSEEVENEDSNSHL